MAASRVTKIVQLSSDPPCLGGALPPEQQQHDKIPKDMFYSRLPRPARLPEYQRTATNQSFSSAEAESLFRKLYDGEFTVSWEEVDSQKFERLEITVENKLLFFRLAKMERVMLVWRREDEGVPLHTDCEALKKLLNNIQVKDICTRVLHRIFRSEAGKCGDVCFRWYAERLFCYKL